MREVVLGTAGHVDHGKTSLVRALTGIDTDRLKEEKERGITIELGFAFLDLPCGHRLGIVDVPGHERFIKNMVAGAAGIDLVAFVIAADEGVMPQTREHFDICRLLGVSRGCVVITKKDMVEPDWLDLVCEEVRDFFKDSFLDDAPLVTVSAVTGEGIDELRTVLDRLVANSPFTEAHGPFRLPVDRIFSMKGFGAVVTGTAISGRIRIGEDVVIYPKGIAAKIRGIQVHSQDVEEVEAGRRTAINIQGVDKMLIDRGDVVASAGALAPAYMYDACFLYLPANKSPFKNGTRVRFHLGTAEIMARIILLDHEVLEPGMEGNVQIRLEEKFGCWPGDHFVVRSYSPIVTIGGGTIYNNDAVKKRRLRPTNAAFFNTYRQGNTEDRILLYVGEAFIAGLPIAALAVRMGLFGKGLRRAVDSLLSRGKVLLVDQTTQRLLGRELYDGLKAKGLSTLTDYHQANPLRPGMAREELKSRLGLGSDDRLFALLLADLIKTGALVTDESVVRLPGHQVALQHDEAALVSEMTAIFRDAGLSPPTVREIRERFAAYPPKMVTEIIEVLVQRNELARVTEDLYFPAAALAALKEKITTHLREHGEIDAQGIKVLTGLTRKFSIPLLEYLDKTKLTIRVGDKRVLRSKG